MSPKINSERSGASSQKDLLKISDYFFPKTRYYGSKRRLDEWLHGRFRKLEFESVLDAFGGSGNVSALFLQMGKKVTFHDGFKFNEITARATLSSKKPAIDRERFKELLASINEREGFISKTFSGMYFLDKENRWLDGLLLKVAKDLARDEKDIALYCAFQACLQKRPYNMFHRPNLNLRTNKKVERSFGNFVTWERSFQDLMIRAYDDLTLARAALPNSAKIVSAKTLMSLKKGADLVYLDPPYIPQSKKIEPYLRRYHFLEGMSDYENWGKLIDKKSPLKSVGGLFLNENWEDPHTSSEMIERLIEKHCESIVALSYLDNGLPSLKELKRMFNKHFASVSVARLPFHYALSRKENTEILIVGVPS